MPLIIILVECGIELIPKQIRKHSAIQKNLSPQIYATQLLDNALHHSAMIKLRKLKKRGRPDIAHLCLLNALGSSLNKSGNLKLYLHTINNKIYEFNPKIRIARNFNRFKGLMAKLLIDGTIETKSSKLITPFNGSLKQLINKFINKKIYLFSINGKLLNNYKDLFSSDLTKNYIAIIGGFQKGGFSEEILGLTDNLISISQYLLDAWVVVSKIITYYELTNDIL